MSGLTTRIGLAWRALTRGGLEAGAGGRRWADDRQMRDPGRAILTDASTIAARAVGFVLNNPHGARIVEAATSNLIGTGITPRPLHPEEIARGRLARNWTAWTDQADAEGRTDHYGQQATAVRDMVTFGEGLAIWTADPMNGAPQLRRLHPEQLDRAKSLLLTGGGSIVQGVEFSANGRIVAYWLRPHAPGDILAGMPLVSERWPASEVIHLFRPLFPGQVRGLSWFAPVLLSAHELDQLIDAMLVRAKVAALHAGFVVDADGANPYGETTGIPPSVSLEPGAMVSLPPGKTVEFPDTPDQGNAVGFATGILRMIAAGAGVTYEMLTGDYSQVNYSSSRAALLEFRRFAEQVQHHTVIHQLCRPAWERFIRYQILAGNVPAAAYQRDRAAFGAKWLPPAWPWVDPQKDAAAAVLEMDNLLRSRAEIVAERGYDVEQVDAEIAADQARAAKLGLARKAPAAAASSAPPPETVQ
ncbi:phage portal protein [Mesorhizobium argentiipisi]|uniref:Phage portal protein n=1 Tax=Mesorhizobium argentiipisi TaxID=3015175 RepID=A0ABU8KE13_9HYPH